MDDRKVKRLERSIEDQGLRYPIHIYRLRQPHTGKYGLAAGQHRLRALINLGYDTVPAFVMKRKEAKAWKSSENLHRNELRALERSEDIVAYAKHRLNLQNVTNGISLKEGKQPHDKGYSKLAAYAEVDRKRIAEAHRYCKLPSAVKEMIHVGRSATNARP